MATQNKFLQFVHACMEGQCAKTVVLNHDPPSSRTFHVVGKIWCGVMGRSVRNGEERGAGNEEGDRGNNGEISVTSVTSRGEDRRTGVNCHC